MGDGEHRRGVEHVVATGIALDLHSALSAVLKANDKVTLDALDIRVYADDVVALGKAVGKHVTARRLGELDRCGSSPQTMTVPSSPTRLMNLAKVASISSIPE